jgi:hypothetical protein
VCRIMCTLMASIELGLFVLNFENNQTSTMLLRCGATPAQPTQTLVFLWHSSCWMRQPTRQQRLQAKAAAVGSFLEIPLDCCSLACCLVCAGGCPERPFLVAAVCWVVMLVWYASQRDWERSQHAASDAGRLTQTPRSGVSAVSGGCAANGCNYCVTHCMHAANRAFHAAPMTCACSCLRGVLKGFPMPPPLQSLFISSIITTRCFFR